jgi:hypothetical protein
MKEKGETSLSKTEFKDRCQSFYDEMLQSIIDDYDHMKEIK